jgi:hypothetical protein
MQHHQMCVGRVEGLVQCGAGGVLSLGWTRRLLLVGLLAACHSVPQVLDVHIYHISSRDFLLARRLLALVNQGL